MSVPFIEDAAIVTSTTCRDLIRRTRRHLNSGMQEARNKLNATVDDTTTSWTFQFGLGGIQDGAVLSCGLETVLVWSVSADSNTATVERGFDGSPVTSHLTTDLVTVNPRWSDFHVFQALNDDILTLAGHGLFQVKSLVFTYDGTARSYDLSDDVQEVLEVRYESSAASNPWPLVKRWTVLRGMPASEFASGVALRLDSPVEAQRTVLVRYRAGYEPLVTYEDVVGTVSGLQPEAEIVPTLGAAAQLAGTRDIRRTDTFGQGDTRRSTEVPPGAPRTAVGKLQELRREHIGAVSAQLHRRWPLASRR